MKLKHVVKDIKEVEEKYKALYEKKGDEWHLDDNLKNKTDDDKGDAGKKIKAYNELLNEAQKKQKELEDKIKELEAKNVAKDDDKPVEEDPKKEKKEKNPKNETDPEILKRFEALEQQNKEKQAKIDELIKQSEDAKFSEHLKSLVESENGNYKLLAPHLKKVIRKETDQLTKDEVWAVIDEKGKTRFNQSERFTIKELIEEYKKSDEFKGAFGNKTSGSNSNKTPEGEPKKQETHLEKAKQIQQRFLTRDYAIPTNDKLQSVINKVSEKHGIKD